MLDCFDFAYECIRIYSVTLPIVARNLCLYIGLLQFCGVILSSPFFFLPFFFSFLFFIILIFKTYYIFSTFIPSFAFPTVLFPLQLIFNIYKSFSSTSVQFCISILSFFPFLSMYLLVLFSLLYSPVDTFLYFCFPVCAC